MKILHLLSIFLLSFVAYSQSKTTSYTTYDYPYRGKQPYPQFEIFKTSDTPKKNLTECYFNGILWKKPALIEYLQKLKREVDYKHQKFVFIFDPNENGKK